MTTLNDVLDAMEKNGYKKIKGEFIEYKEEISSDYPFPQLTDKVIGACAIGQAALNLNKDPYDVDGIVSGYLTNIGPGAFAIWQAIMVDNDRSNKRIRTIARTARKNFKDIGIDLDAPIVVVYSDGERAEL